MRRLAYICLILVAVGTLGQQWLGAIVARMVPGGAQLPWAMLPLCILLGILLWRFERVEQALSSTQQQYTTLDAKAQETAQHLAQLTQTTQQVGTSLQTLQHTLTAQEWLWPGKLLLSQRRFDEAIKAFQEALIGDPEHPSLHWALGEALHGAKRYAEALPHLRRGLQPDNATHLGYLAQCEHALGYHAEAEAHLLSLFSIRGERRQEDLLTLAMVQSDLDPERARDTLLQALALNPYNSAVRYQLIDLELHLEAYERAIVLATEGISRNAADVGCCVSRAEAYFRRGLPEDEDAIMRDLATAQARNRRDYNIYRLRGALYQRQASRTKQQPESQEALHRALETYTEGLKMVPPKFHAHLLALQSRVLLQLKRFDEAVTQAQRAVEHYSGHVSNHLALAFARLAARQWQAAAQAAEQGLPWAGWGGKIWLTAINVLARACAGQPPATLGQQCAALTEALEMNARPFTVTESWAVISDILWETALRQPPAGREFITDTIALLESSLTPADYRSKWALPSPTPSSPQAA